MSVSVLPSIHLNRYLEVFRKHLDDPLISEICVNGSDGGYWIERSGAAALEFIEAPSINDSNLRQLAQMLASNTGQSINKEKPLLSCALPTGERVQVVFPPVSPNGVALSIRKQVVRMLSLDQFAALGAFAQVGLVTDTSVKESDPELCGMLKTGLYMEFIIKAAQKRKNIIISGGTSTGKTTLLNAVLQCIGPSERIITIEDTAELQPPQQNRLSLLASKGEQGVAKVTIQDLLEASLRLRPDRILLGELRGKEAYTFLRAINTGHPGSVTTVHADNPHAAIQQVALMVQQGDIKMTHDQILSYIHSIVDVIIQLSRVNGKRIVSHVWYSGYQE